MTNLNPEGTRITLDFFYGSSKPWNVNARTSEGSVMFDEDFATEGEAKAMFEQLSA